MNFYGLMSLVSKTTTKINYYDEKAKEVKKFFYSIMMMKLLSIILIIGSRSCTRSQLVGILKTFLRRSRCQTMMRQKGMEKVEKKEEEKKIT